MPSCCTHGGAAPELYPRSGSIPPPHSLGPLIKSVFSLSKIMGEVVGRAEQALKPV